ncbi:MAG: rRNA maturation RNase YbeY [Pseudomonadota bacterium]
MTEVQVVCESSELPDADALSAWAARAYDAVADGATGAELCIRVVDAEEGHALNLTYRGRDYATNVLSFPADLPIEDVCLLGDIVLCAPVVTREAVAQGKSLAAHYAHLVVHGVLHLLGFDHEEEAAATRMEAQEIAILGQYGIANPFELDAAQDG